MKLTGTKTNENYDVGRWVSENNVWEMGLHRVLFGIRVVAGRVGDGCYDINYCAGDDEGFALLLLATVFRIMSLLPEDIKPYELKRMMPTYERRPINLDPCWENLLNLAAELEKTNTCSDDDKVFAGTGEERDRI